ncbi:MAG: pseudouridine synthase [Eubacteriales bacterium]
MDNSDQKPQRLQKVLAAYGIASRRSVEKLIDSRKIKVNGSLVEEQGIKVSLSDVIEVEGKKINLNNQQTKYYYLFNKPVGVITSVKDPRGRRTVLDYFKIDERVFPVGRLDYDTSGLLMLTNDGEMTFRLTHPSYGVEKTYRVWTEKEVPDLVLAKMKTGLILEDGKTSPAKVKRIREKNSDRDLYYIVEISIHEGKNRQVRRMFEKVGYPVIKLHRVSFGPLKLDSSFKLGEYRHLNNKEISLLKNELGLS